MPRRYFSMAIMAVWHRHVLLGDINRTTYDNSDQCLLRTQDGYVCIASSCPYNWRCLCVFFHCIFKLCRLYD